MDTAPKPLVIASIREAVPVDNNEVRLKVDAVVDGQRSELEIAVSTELAPRVALTLLETSIKARALRDDLAPALEPVAIGVVPASDAETVRLHMLFEQGAVLPIEIKTEAAELLKLDLQRQLGSGSAISWPPAKFFALLNEIEREVQTPDLEERRRIRQLRTRPVAESMREWLIAQRQRVPTGSATAKAIDYSLNRWTALTPYVGDDELPPHNNWVENQIRPIAVEGGQPVVRRQLACG